MIKLLLFFFCIKCINACTYVSIHMHRYMSILLRRKTIEFSAVATLYKYATGICGWELLKRHWPRVSRLASDNNWTAIMEIHMYVQYTFIVSNLGICLLRDQVLVCMRSCSCCSTNIPCRFALLLSVYVFSKEISSILLYIKKHSITRWANTFAIYPKIPSLFGPLAVSLKCCIPTHYLYTYKHKHLNINIIC